MLLKKAEYRCTNIATNAITKKYANSFPTESVGPHLIIYWLSSHQNFIIDSISPNKKHSVSRQAFWYEQLQKENMLTKYIYRDIAFFQYGIADCLVCTVRSHMGFWKLAQRCLSSLFRLRRFDYKFRLDACDVKKVREAVYKSSVEVLSCSLVTANSWVSSHSNIRDLRFNCYMVK